MSGAGRCERFRPVAARKTELFFTVKDRAMTQEASVGFMVWEGKSLGPLNNVVRLLRQGKATLTGEILSEFARKLKPLVMISARP